MDKVRRHLGIGLAAALAVGALPRPLRAEAAAARPEEVLDTWYRLILELVRHTPTYSPPVASRAFAYLGVIGYEAVASGDPALVSLAGQLNGLAPGPARESGMIYHDAVLLQAALADATASLFGNTGPTGQRAIDAMTRNLSADAATGVPADVADRSVAFGQAVAAHVLAWAATDGGAVIENMGFPYSYTPNTNPGAWVPTSRVALQQAPLLPAWGSNRPFAMPSGDACPLPPPPAYSEDPSSAFYAEALEVYEVSRNLTDEKRLIARFWSDDPMLSPTPPGHWLSIARDLLAQQDAPVAARAEVLVRLGITVADAFISCWASKYEYDLLRPVTYIRRTMDPKWEPLLITPPFPEYPSGHSTQSGAAAAVLTAAFGEDFAFEDRTHVDDGLPGRTYPSFSAAAEEAALSRLYGGIHFRSAIARGLEQGQCVGAHAVALKTRA
jgi:hypothetical protein